MNCVFLPLTSKPTGAEIIRTLAYPKFKLTADEQHELLADYLPYCHIVDVPVSGLDVPLCRDPADQKFLELASAGQASVMVTDDKGLLALTGLTPFSIVTAQVVVSAISGS